MLILKEAGRGDYDYSNYRILFSPDEANRPLKGLKHWFIVFLPIL
jgi:hypothetical protein